MEKSEGMKSFTLKMFEQGYYFVKTKEEEQALNKLQKND